MLSPLVYANNFIKRAIERDEQLSPMKLQKLLYFLYARYSYRTNQPLFADNFEKWQYGPALSEVYTAFQSFGANNINRFHRDSDGEVNIASESHKEFMECFDEVWGRFGWKSGIELSNLTHTEGSAWCRVQDEGAFLKLEDIKEDGDRFFKE